LIQGKTVSIIGSLEGIKEARQIIIDCMNNVHPIYNIKELMVKRELKKNPNVEKEDWSKLLPKFKKNVGGQKKQKKIKKKKEYTPFPPEREKSKIDLEIESGIYFLPEEQKKQIKLNEKIKAQKIVSQDKREKKKEQFIPKQEEKKNIVNVNFYN
jgi:ribosomal RNA assembly protein